MTVSLFATHAPIWQRTHRRRFMQKSGTFEWAVMTNIFSFPAATIFARKGKSQRKLKTCTSKEELFATLKEYKMQNVAPSKFTYFAIARVQILSRKPLIHGKELLYFHDYWCIFGINSFSTFADWVINKTRFFCNLRFHIDTPFGVLTFHCRRLGCCCCLLDCQW